MAAAVAVISVRGFAAMTITEVVRTARVSPNGFYAQFASLEACLMEAYDTYVAALVASITTALDAADTPDERIAAAIGGYLAALDGDRQAARAFLIEFDAVGAAARIKRREGVATFAALLAQEHAAMREREPALGALPATAYVAVSNGIRVQACDALETTSAPLSGLAPDIVRWVTALVRGAS
ncbi:hypothetical protein DSM112329_00984 [Paraconexibacter sp. AEG42_29]|uniref:HTH tetR-type domain-containing protein n=2 Tax=Paraconexibacter sp. AEG42_29 TaxID=2997339 RepID=A0AAU7AR29_9ACTN